jgi:AbrB family looped-hinge helix DNA binding protein
MSITTITLSSKGQVVIPKNIRDELHWETGTELELISTPSGITLRSISQKGKLNLADLRGILQYDGPPITTEELCKPVELTDEECREYRK